MARVSEGEVKRIIDTALTYDQVTPFLRAANNLVTSTLADEGYGAEDLRQIEAWLAAHFVAVRDPRVKQEKIGDANVHYDGETGSGLASTRYGQQVLLLEYKGILAQMDKQSGGRRFRAMI